MGECQATVKRFGLKRYINAIHLPFTIYQGRVVSESGGAEAETMERPRGLGWMT